MQLLKPGHIAGKLFEFERSSCKYIQSRDQFSFESLQSHWLLSCNECPRYFPCHVLKHLHVWTKDFKEIMKTLLSCCKAEVLAIKSVAFCSKKKNFSGQEICKGICIGASLGLCHPLHAKKDEYCAPLPPSLQTSTCLDKRFRSNYEEKYCFCYRSADVVTKVLVAISCKQRYL